MFKSCSAFLILLNSLFITVFCAEEVVTGTPGPLVAEGGKDRALIAFEKVVTGPLVAGMNVTVTYEIYNVGLHPATGVSLRDSSYPASRFESEGSTRMQWEALAPGQSVRHSISIRPRRAGQLFVSPPSVSYTDSNDGSQHTSRLASSEDDDAVLVEDLIEFRRRNDTHTTSWSIYSLAFLLLSIAPFGVSASMVKGLNRDGQQKKSS